MNKSIKLLNLFSSLVRTVSKFSRVKLSNMTYLFILFGFCLKFSKKNLLYKHYLIHSMHFEAQYLFHFVIF